MKTLAQYKEAYAEATLESLHIRYAKLFGEPAVDSETGEPTNDQANLVRKIAYSDLMKDATDHDEEVPPRVVTLANKAFDAPFVVRKPKGEPRYTIQMFIVDTLHNLVGTGGSGTLTVEELGAQVVEKYPESKYALNPAARMTIDIRKFNQGAFKYAKECGKVPANEAEHYVAKKVEKEPVEA